MTAGHVADMVEAGWNVVVDHGNGPQMGFILRRSELSIHEVAPVPMDYAGADLQGAIGYMFVKAFHNDFRQRGMAGLQVAVVTETLVDPADPAFANPTKPIGSRMSEARAKDWRPRRAGRSPRMPAAAGGASFPPRPRRIVDLARLRDLAASGYVVIACGGGGIPVIADAAGDLHGVEAVIDKDHASSLLARELGADLLLVSTGVKHVAVNSTRPTSAGSTASPSARPARSTPPTISTGAAWARRSRRPSITSPAAGGKR